jgi:DNA mismatch repair protein MutL
MRAFLRPVRALPDEVARKIAAGEVIDRPAAVIRELIDNSIDSGATRITVEIAGGGTGSIRVTDNGHGMTADDLSICTHAHTTSKIAREDDLLSLATLGFRGEALSSIQAVSRLEITTTRDGREAWKLEFGKVIPARLAEGTIVQIDGLFENFPARKQFLKRAQAESALCRQVFIEKALAWPEIEFRFSSDGGQKIILPPAPSLRERFIAALEPKEPESFFYELSGLGEGFSFSVVVGSPDVVRSDRRQLMVFVNGRRIMEYSLLQALEYGAEGHFPNGAHPAGALFVTVNPELVDFNIHPAKREARFRDPAALHHAVSLTVRDFFRRYAIAELSRERGEDENEEPELSGFSGALSPRAMSDVAAYRETRYGNDGPARNFSRTPDFSAAASAAAGRMSNFFGIARLNNEQDECDRTSSDATQAIPDIPQDFRFLGQTLGTFLVVEKNGLLFLVDQHAAHERILYDELMARKSERQELLVPYRVETASDEESRHIAEATRELESAGFSLEDEGDGIWQVTAVPLRWTGTQKDLADELLDTSIRPDALVSHIYATAACRAACKDGDMLDPLTARSLVERAFALAEPVCPHGRPLWIVMDREELFRRIKRT